jgi:hypothetical protein
MTGKVFFSTAPVDSVSPEDAIMSWGEQRPCWTVRPGFAGTADHTNVVAACVHVIRLPARISRGSVDVVYLSRLFRH